LRQTRCFFTKNQEIIFLIADIRITFVTPGRKKIEIVTPIEVQKTGKIPVVKKGKVWPVIKAGPAQMTVVQRKPQFSDQMQR
jgi:hypothetical protein